MTWWSKPLTSRDLYFLLVAGVGGLGLASLSIWLGDSPGGLACATAGALVSGGAQGALWAKAMAPMRRP